MFMLAPLFRVFSLAVIFVTSFSVAAADIGAKADLAINALLRDLAIYDLMRDIPQTISDGLVQRQSEISSMPAEQKERLTAVSRDSFSEAALAKRVRAVLRKDFDESRYTTLQRLLQSPVGKRVTELKRAAYTSQATAAIHKLAKDHDAKTRDPQRMSLYSQLDDASADTEFFVAAQALSIQSLLRLVKAADGSGQILGQERADHMLRATYDQLLKPSKFTTTMTYLYAFQDQSADELQQYLQFYRFGDVQWFLNQVMSAMVEAMEQASVEAEKKLTGK